MKNIILFVIILISSISFGCNNNKPVTIICPWAAGGGTDLVSRFWADALQKKLDRTFVVVNKTGGSGIIGHAAGANAKPDGNTIAMITAELSTMHWMGIKPPLTYKDFRCVLQMNADAAAIIVRNDSSWESLEEMLQFIKMNPGKLKMSGTATGGTWDLARAGLLTAAKLPVESVVWVPTKGAAPSIVELLGGHIDAVCCSVPEAASQIEAGELKALVVMSPERLPDFPEIQTVKESGLDWVAVGWRGLAVPVETPDEIVSELQKACQEIAESEEFKNFMNKNGFTIEIRNAEEFTKFLEEQDKQWKSVVEAAGYAN